MTTEKENKTPRITKANRCEDIIALLKGEPVKHGTTVEIAEQYMVHEIELLQKKNTSNGSKKVSETQKQNMQYMEEIMTYIATLEPGAKVTCTQLAKNIPSLADFNTSKISYLVNALEDAGRLIRPAVKKSEWQLPV